MSNPPIKTSQSLPRPSNDNRKPSKSLRVITNIPPSMPVQRVEVEVFASLLDDLQSLVANDNPEPEE